MVGKTRAEDPLPDLLKFFLFWKKIIQFLKVTFHLHLLQNNGYILLLSSISLSLSCT